MYDAAATQASIDEAVQLIAASQGAIAREQMIVRKGDIVNSETERILQSLEMALGSNSSRTDLLTRYAGELLLMLVLMVAFLFYFRLYAREVVLDNSRFL
ncbi:hypothetical protein RZS08_00885, partial [Arthrospira platensis SPKY1]|nr:hypothetical protein [Arthrospira platensis SPKY1]